jgi:hypothetical protein
LRAARHHVSSTKKQHLARACETLGENIEFAAVASAEAGQRPSAWKRKPVAVVLIEAAMMMRVPINPRIGVI